MTRLHIGVCGYATAGKDVVADVLVDRFGFVKVNMSDALDRYLQVLDPMVTGESVSDLHREFGLDLTAPPRRYSEIRREMSLTKAKRLPEVRRLMQKLGTEVGRDIDPMLWVNVMKRNAAQHDYVVTTGIRYPEEADAVDVLIHVTRPGVGPLNDHTSENLDAIFARANYQLPNSETLEHFQGLIVEFFTNVKPVEWMVERYGNPRIDPSRLDWRNDFASRRMFGAGSYDVV